MLLNPGVAPATTCSKIRKGPHKCAARYLTSKIVSTIMSTDPQF